MTPGAFKDYFSSRAAVYAACRPRYPAELIRFVSALPARRRTAWDCATGSGQAAVPLADHFDHVIATDASAAQIAHAVRHPRVGYAVALAGASGIGAGCVDLITVAQALHWLPLDALWADVCRVAAPGAALAAWCYDRLTIDPAVDAVIERYYTETCGPYWAPERRLVETGYRTIAMPIDEVPAPPLAIEVTLTLAELAGYLRSWSATRNLADAIGRDPVVEITAELRPLWGDPERRRAARWPLHVRSGRVIG